MSNSQTDKHDRLIDSQTNGQTLQIICQTHTHTHITYVQFRRKGRHYNPYNIRKGQKIQTNTGITDIDKLSAIKDK